ncbi:hypothetical protein ACHAXS_007926 [Conticribra weissflogii]
MVSVVTTADTDAGKRFISAVDDILSPSLLKQFGALMSESDDDKKIAFDCEGVNLSRLGSLEIVSICFQDMEIFLVDFGNNPCPKIKEKVKEIFESSKVVKIIHDCRMDCDALFHLHGIKVNNVHDTSCYQTVLTGGQKNLNDTLACNGIRTNSHRDKSVYKRNPRFWATRPLTNQMIEWASADVDKLFKLSQIQLDKISISSKTRAVTKSTEFTKKARDMKVKTGLRVNSSGLFIGRGGVNVRRLEERTGTFMYQDGGTWFVYYENESSLAAVKRAMDN